jgi:signal transduction histidine kinase
MAMTRAIHTAAPQRVDGVEELSPGAGADFWRELGVTAAIAAPIVVDGEVWGVISASRTGDEPFPEQAQDRLADMGALIAQALANAAARAELSASRMRIVQAADEARRKLERNLHDGAQQRLVSLSINLRLAESKIDSAPDEAREALRGASEELSQALAELRELARGIHPAILSDRGLGPALQALADRATFPVEVSNELDVPLPAQVEAAAYYVVSEALANVAKHADAEVARVRVSRRDGVATVEIEDDGVGGADAAGGSGLRGLADRVEALDGRFGVEPANGCGTRVWAEIPYL